MPPRRPRKGSLAALTEELMADWETRPKPPPDRKPLTATLLHSEYNECGLPDWPEDRQRNRGGSPNESE